MRISYNAPVILTITFVCVSIMALDTVFQGAITQSLFMVYPTFSFLNPLDYFRLFSHVLGHANWAHLMGNFTFILLLGPILEEKYGSKTLILMMFITALITGILNVLFFNTALLGASGIVFMFIILSSITNIQAREIPLTFILISFLFIGKEVLDAFKTDSISQFAHIIGGISGAIYGLNFKKIQKPKTHF